MTYIFGGNERPELSLAVIVGAGGMGAALARRLAQRHRILIADIDEVKAAAAARLLREEGADAQSIGCDVTEPASVANLAERVSQNGGLGVLTHVAGLSPSAGDFDRIVRVNLTGPALVAAALLPQARQGSVAILIASLAAHNFNGDPAVRCVLDDPASTDLADRLRDSLGAGNATPASAYVCSKYGLLAYARRHAADWGARGARIVSLSPGMIATPMGAKEFEHSEGKRQLFALTPLKREGTLHEIADAVEFLASDRASFITGTDLLVDGGLAGATSQDQSRPMQDRA
jgi:NAD(P)-dependent dehydrogenase (short-subunit alcohol dehydrogenase family)